MVLLKGRDYILSRMSEGGVLEPQADMMLLTIPVEQASKIVELEMCIQIRGVLRDVDEKTVSFVPPGDWARHGTPSATES